MEWLLLVYLDTICITFIILGATSHCWLMFRLTFRKTPVHAHFCPARFPHLTPGFPISPYKTKDCLCGYSLPSPFQEWLHCSKGDQETTLNDVSWWRPFQGWSSFQCGSIGEMMIKHLGPQSFCNCSVISVSFSSRGVEGPPGGVCQQAIPWACESGAQPETGRFDPSTHRRLESGVWSDHWLLWCTCGIHSRLVGVAGESPFKVTSTTWLTEQKYVLLVL